VSQPAESEIRGGTGITGHFMGTSFFNLYQDRTSRDSGAYYFYYYYYGGMRLCALTL